MDKAKTANVVVARNHFEVAAAEQIDAERDELGMTAGVELIDYFESGGKTTVKYEKRIEIEFNVDKYVPITKKDQGDLDAIFAATMKCNLLSTGEHFRSYYMGVTDISEIARIRKLGNSRDNCVWTADIIRIGAGVVKRMKHESMWKLADMVWDRFKATESARRLE